MNESKRRKLEAGEDAIPDSPAAGERQLFGPDHVLNGILIANAVTLLGALVQHWPVLPVLWVYWGQSVIIGIANVIRMLSLREGAALPARSASAPRGACSTPSPPSRASRRHGGRWRTRCG